MIFFLLGLDNLPEAYDPTQYLPFVDSWGTHVPLNCSFGGKVQVMEVMKSCIYQEVERETVKEGLLEMIHWEINGKGEKPKKHQDFQDRSEYQSSIILGGNSDIENITKRIETFKDISLPIYCESFIPLYEFVSNSKKKSNVKRTIEMKIRNNDRRRVKLLRETDKHRKESMIKRKIPAMLLFKDPFKIFFKKNYDVIKVFQIGSPFELQSTTYKYWAGDTSYIFNIERDSFTDIRLYYGYNPLSRTCNSSPMWKDSGTCYLGDLEFIKFDGDCWRCGDCLWLWDCCCKDVYYYVGFKAEINCEVWDTVKQRCVCTNMS